VIVVVLGMHKSGTTLVSQMLHHSGINMGEFDQGVSYDQGNKYERQDALHLDMDILGAEDYEVLDLTPGGQATMNDQQRSQMKDLIAACAQTNDDWGFKDPRACLTYNLWAEELPAHKIIAVYRDPAEVWPRFKWHGMRKHHTNFQRAQSYLQRWQEHNLNIISFLQQTSMPYLVLNYHDLMSRPETLGTLDEFLGTKLEDRRKPGLYRSRAKRDVFLKWADWNLGRKTGHTVASTMAGLRAIS